MTFTIRMTFEDRPNVVGRAHVVGDMPALIGSAKQVAWAEDLRAEAAAKIPEELCRMTKTVIGVMQANEADAIAEANARLDAIFDQPGGDKLRAALNKMFSTADAK